MDEVDRIIAAWRAEVPGMDTEPLAVLSRVSRLARHLDLARKRCFAAHGLEVWEFDVLAVLRRAGEPYRLTPGQLINQTHVTSGTMTNRVVRLAERGLVTRTANPADGRGVLVQLTPEGRRRVDAALADLVQSEEALVAALSAEERGTLAAILRRLLTAQETRGR